MNELTTILSSAMRLTAPLAFAGAGEQVAERSGTLNISIEAMMLGGAYFGLLGTSIFSNTAMGLVTGMVAGFVVAWLHAQFSHRLNANTFVVGLTLNVLLLGLTSFLDETIEMTPRQAQRWEVPLLSDLPVVGDALFSARWPMYLLVLVIPLSWWLVRRTRWASRCGRRVRTRRPPTSRASTSTSAAASRSTTAGSSRGSAAPTSPSPRWGRSTRT